MAAPYVGSICLYICTLAQAGCVLRVDGSVTATYMVMLPGKCWGCNVLIQLCFGTD